MSRLTFIEYLYKVRNSINESNLTVLNQVKTAVQDPHEALTACCCVMDNLDDEIKTLSSNASNTNVLIKRLLEFFKSAEDATAKVEGLSANDLKSFLEVYDLDFDSNELPKDTKSFIDRLRTALPQALSAAKLIRQHFPVIEKVYITGAVWPEILIPFKIQEHGMTDFNSSDIICQNGDQYLGVSLKKKKKDKDADPTLINKSIERFFENSKYISNKIENVITNWYNTVVDEMIQSIDTLEKPKSSIDNLKGLELLGKYFKIESNKNIIRDYINTELKGPNSLFKHVDEILNEEEALNLIETTLFNIILKPELHKLKDKKFDFALVTGAGYIDKNKVVVEKGKYIPIESIATVYNDFISTGKFKFIQSPDKFNPFDGTGPAKLFYRLMHEGKNGNMNILDLEIRYKGSYTASPQFQATMHPDFIHFLKDR